MTMRIGRRAAIAGAAALAAPWLPGDARAAGQVVVGTWGGDYAQLLSNNIDKPLLGPKGIEVLQDINDQNPRKTKMIAERASRRGSMDVSCLSDIDSYSMSMLGVWNDVTEQEVPSLKHVLKPLRTPYAIPHIYSGKVVLYNPDKVRPAPKGFRDLWDPKWKGRVGISDILYNTNIACAALAFGGNMHDLEPGKKALMELKRRVEPKIYPSNEALATALKSEEVWLAPMWLARGVFWRKGGVNVAHAVPEEGAIPYISCAGVPKNAQHKANGFAYLEAMLDPAAQVAFAKTMSYAPTVDNAPIDPELMKQIGFTPEQQAKFNTPDYEYMAKNASQLLDFWNREFKA